MNLHEELIAELLSGRVSLSPRENAAVNEINGLRARVVELEAEKHPKSTVHDAVAASRSTKKE